MTIYHLPYGDRTLDFSVPFGTVDLLSPPGIKPASDPRSQVKLALDAPVGGFRFEDHQSARYIAIAVNDKTRPVPLGYILPELLNRLDGLGIYPDRIHFYIATGTHLPPTPEEFLQILPETIVSKYKIEAHDCDNRNQLKYLGETTRGTPIWINKNYLESDFRIVVGDIEPHHFMGYSGGVKGVCIGLAGRETINRNHMMLMDPMADIGVYDENPMRQDIEEIGDIVRVDLAVNALLTPTKEIFKVIAGTPRGVMAYGIPLSRQHTQTPIQKSYDLVIASAGGYPKDINLYQAQKAISHAAQFCRPGGVIILAAECREGSGSGKFEAFMQGVTTFQQALAKFKGQPFEIGPHKAFQIARQAARNKIILISNMAASQVRNYMLEPANSIAEALDKTNAISENIQAIAVMPYATAMVTAQVSEPNGGKNGND